MRSCLAGISEVAAATRDREPYNAVESPLRLRRVSRGDLGLCDSGTGRRGRGGLGGRRSGVGSRRHLPGYGSLFPDPPLGPAHPAPLALPAAGPQTLPRERTTEGRPLLSPGHSGCPDSRLWLEPGQRAGGHSSACLAPVPHAGLVRSLLLLTRVIVFRVVERIKWDNDVRRRLRATGS